MTTCSKLKEQLDLNHEEWLQSRDEFLNPTRREIGNYLRNLQNQGWSISALAELWGTKDRKTIYDFLEFADEPHNGMQVRRRKGETLTEALRRAKAPKKKKKPTKVKRLRDHLKKTFDEENNTITVTTTEPVPVVCWPKDMPEHARPTEPWEGAATWELDTSLIVSDINDGLPLHAAQMVLGGPKNLC